MKFNAAGLLLCTFLVGCGGGPAPFGEPEGSTDTETGEVDENGNPIGREGVPPGTTSPSPNSSIYRSEPTSSDGTYNGNGYATDIKYFADDPDTEAEDDEVFIVDGLAFDGSNKYKRGAIVSSLNQGKFNVYEASQYVPDSLNDKPVNQLYHRAIYGVSKNRDADGNPTTQFAIVRTGNYVGYGFGGFIYQRDNTVTLPTSGQATFSGSSAGMRDFDGTTGLEYTTADVAIDIDFNDFNSATGGRGDGVKGEITNRRIFDLKGNDITAAVVNQINLKSNSSLTSIPDARFAIGPGVLDDNGDLVGTMTNTEFFDNNGGKVEYESGSYYAIVAGDDPNEIVGVFVLENDAEFDDATVRETSGFIVYRDPAPETP